MSQQDGRIVFRNHIQQIGFAQVPHVLTLDSSLSDGALRLYLLLLKYARQKDNCWPGITRLANDLGKSDTTIERRLAELVDRGLITREQRGHGKTAMTYIEDIGTVYSDLKKRQAPSSPKNGDPGSSPKNEEAASPAKNEEASLPKNGEALASPKMETKEHEEEETCMKGDDDSIYMRKQSLELLTDFGVHRSVAEKLVKQCAYASIEGWIRYTEQATGLHNPVAFLVSKLKAGEPVPTQSRSEDKAGNRRSYLNWLNPDAVGGRAR